MAAPAGAWQQQILQRIGAPVTPQNLLFVNDWQRAEGGVSTNNPFNTSQPMPGSTGLAGNESIRNYVSPQQGIDATVQTLQNGRYSPILTALRNGSSAQASASALAASPWGTGSLVQKMLGGGAVAAPAVPQPVSPPATAAPRPPGLAGPLQQAFKLLGVQAPAALGNPTAGPSLPVPPLLKPQATTGVTAPAGSVVGAARSFLGVPYKWGGNSPSTGLDCSAFLQQTMAKVGVKIPRTTYDQFKTGKPVDLTSLQPGDAVFTEPGKDGPNHVGLYIGNGQVQESPHTGDVNKVIPLKDFLGGGFVGARRYAA